MITKLIYSYKRLNSVHSLKGSALNNEKAKNDLCDEYSRDQTSNNFTHSHTIYIFEG